jgi:hypothetical protein
MPIGNKTLIFKYIEGMESSLCEIFKINIAH